MRIPWHREGTGPQEIPHGVLGQRRREIVALHLEATPLPQEPKLAFGLDTLGNHTEAELPRQAERHVTARTASALWPRSTLPAFGAPGGPIGKAGGRR
jgi:hypothetical protein